MADALKYKAPVSQQRKSTCFPRANKMSSPGTPSQHSQGAWRSNMANVTPRALLDRHRGQKEVIGSWDL